jgi:hypothetical protein
MINHGYEIKRKRNVIYLGIRRHLKDYEGIFLETAEIVHGFMVDVAKF